MAMFLNRVQRHLVAPRQPLAVLYRRALSRATPLWANKDDEDVLAALQGIALEPQTETTSAQPRASTEPSPQSAAEVTEGAASEAGNLSTMLKDNDKKGETPNSIPSWARLATLSGAAAPRTQDLRAVLHKAADQWNARRALPKADLSRFPGGMDNDDAVYALGLVDASLSVEEQIKAHTDFSSQLEELKSEPAYARYFGHLSATALGRNPHMSAERKREILQNIFTELKGAIAARKATA